MSKNVTNNAFHKTEVYNPRIDPTYHELRSDNSERWEALQPPEYWDYRRKWSVLPETRTVSSFPIHLDIEATTNCDLKCPMCPRTIKVRSGKFLDIINIDFDKYKLIIDDGVKKGLSSVKYNYLSEPTLNPQLVDMIKYAKSAGVLDVMFNTNAVTLNEDLSYQLIESGLDQIFFSFDSPYRDKYNRIRIGADYDKVLSNVKSFIKIRDNMGSIKPLTRVSMTRMKGNDDEWKALFELFSPIVDVLGYGEYVNFTNKQELFNTERFNKNNRKKENNFCCSMLWNRMFIRPNGTVKVCCADPNDHLNAGNAFETPVQDIWLGEKYQKLRKLHASGRSEEISTCAKCPMQYY